MNEVALMQLHVLPATLGQHLALYFMGSPFPLLLGAEFPPVSKGEIILDTPLILVYLQHIHGDMSEPDPLCLQTPLPVDTSGR